MAGLQYGETIHTTFTPKEKLRLDRESHNAYDKYAVALYKQDKKVGYIPKVHSRIIASLLDNGVELDVEVRYFDKDKEPWDRLWVSIWQVV
ncbi:MAG: HIRAN domain-containing protein [Sulfurovum sp.]|nr:HIRAN domain-containing protein [Sulfurovum sp.]